MEELDARCLVWHIKPHLHFCIVLINVFANCAYHVLRQMWSTVAV